MAEQPVGDQGGSGRNITGTYVSEVTSNSGKHFSKKKHRELIVRFVQNGNIITGQDRDKNVKIHATREGNIVNFELEPGGIDDFNPPRGVWRVSADGFKMGGSWEVPGKNAAGIWNLNTLMNLLLNIRVHVGAIAVSL